MYQINLLLTTWSKNICGLWPGLVFWLEKTQHRIYPIYKTVSSHLHPQQPPSTHTNNLQRSNYFILRPFVLKAPLPNPLADVQTYF